VRTGRAFEKGEERDEIERRGIDFFRGKTRKGHIVVLVLAAVSSAGGIEGNALAFFFERRKRLTESKKDPQLTKKKMVKIPFLGRN